jgi:hypothetical protein
MSKITLKQEGNLQLTVEHDGVVVLDYAISNITITIDKEGLTSFFRSLQSIHSKPDTVVK